MYAEPTAKYSIVLDFYMEQEAKDYQSKQAQSVGWLFTPIHALPVQNALNMAAGAAAQNSFSLLKGSARMLLDPTKSSFEPEPRGYIIRVDSIKVSDRLQSDLAPVKKLISSSALFSDNDAIPGIHCPLDDKEYDRA